MSNWKDATTKPPACPKCSEDRQIERVNHEMVCAVCAHAWVPKKP